MWAISLLPNPRKGRGEDTYLFRPFAELGGTGQGQGAGPGEGGPGFRSVFYQALVLLVGEEHVETCGNVQKTELEDVCEALLMKVVTGKLS